MQKLNMQKLTKIKCAKIDFIVLRLDDATRWNSKIWTSLFFYTTQHFRPDCVLISLIGYFGRSFKDYMAQVCIGSFWLHFLCCIRHNARIAIKATISAQIPSTNLIDTWREHKNGNSWFGEVLFKFMLKV